MSIMSKQSSVVLGYSSKISSRMRWNEWWGKM